MDVTKKCGICGYEFTYNDSTIENPFTKPYSDGAKYYYNPWHFGVEKCPECGYASKDISSSYNKKIINDDKYQEISSMNIIVDLNNARPNRVEKYLRAGYYYDSIGDVLSNIKCLLQAGDYLYAELMYWDEYVLDSGDSISAIISKRQYNELKKFADYLFNSALDKLEIYVKENPSDIDNMILLAGSLCDGNKIQSIKGTRYLNHLKGIDLSEGQRLAVDFLIQSVC